MCEQRWRKCGGECVIVERLAAFRQPLSDADEARGDTSRCDPERRAELENRLRDRRRRNVADNLPANPTPTGDAGRDD